MQEVDGTGLSVSGYVASSKYLATVGDCTVRLPTCSKQKGAQKATTQLFDRQRCKICATCCVGQIKLPSKHQPCVTVWCISSATRVRENTPPEKVNFALQLTQTRSFASRFGLALKRHGWPGKQKGLGSIPWLWLSRLFKSSLALLLSTWLNLFRSTSLLGLCALLRMKEPFASPSSKEKQHGGRAFCISAVQVWNSLSFAHHHSPSLPAFKTSPKTYLFKQQYNNFSAAQFLSLSVSPRLQISLPPPPPPPPPSQPRVCVRAPVCTCFLLVLCACKPVSVCARAHAPARFCVRFCHVLYEDVNFRMFCTLVYYWFL